MSDSIDLGAQPHGSSCPALLPSDRLRPRAYAVAVALVDRWTARDLREGKTKHG